MDLKSMLNDSAGQRPPLHKPHSSYDARTVEITGATEHLSRAQSQSHSQSHPHAHAHPQSNRPLPYAPPLQPVDSRGHSTGGYFGVQSPHQNNLNSASTHVSTPSAGPHSAYARSPGGQSQPYTPRENIGPPTGAYNSFVPSPSLSVNQPPTPGSAYQHQNHTPLSAHSQNSHPHSYVQAQSPRGSNPPNGHPRQITPNTPHAYPQPATPLGPPISYNKISPHTQRPPSQGLEQHYRKSSYGSVGSAHGREHSINLQQTPEIKPEPVPKQSIPDIERVKERERSVSVSPKTIPQPSPYRQMSVSSQPGSQSRPSVQSPSETRAMSNISDVHMRSSSVSQEVKSEYQTPTPRASIIPGEQQPPPSRGPSAQQEALDTVSSPAQAQVAPSLKRNASFMSDQSQASQMQPRKRLKRDEIPIFARNARQRPLRLGTGGQKLTSRGPPRPPPPSQPVQSNQPASQGRPAPQSIQNEQTPTTNGTIAGTGAGTGAPPIRAGEARWEASIADIVPYEGLSRRVCDWIYQNIGAGVPPSGGAMFEIEAKLGEIFDVDRGERAKLPFDTEGVFNKSKFDGRTKFESSMNMEQHRLLNNYLNEITREAFLQAQKGERQEILYSHPHEVDEFFELTAEGQRNINPSILEYTGRSRLQPRVRQTRDRDTGQLKAQIIKTRVADLEIYNPETDFDCRISISLESPWEGNPNWLVPMGDSKVGRHKDRMSYRHQAYQIDLTQVSHDNQADMQHELEIEISTEQIRREIDNLQNGRPSKYEELIGGLLNNVRLLSRKASILGPRRG